jgi:hypothetical protein
MLTAGSRKTATNGLEDSCRINEIAKKCWNANLKWRDNSLRGEPWPIGRMCAKASRRFDLAKIQEKT